MFTSFKPKLFWQIKNCFIQELDFDGSVFSWQLYAIHGKKSFRSISEGLVRVYIDKQTDMAKSTQLITLIIYIIIL